MISLAMGKKVVILHRLKNVVGGREGGFRGCGGRAAEHILWSIFRFLSPCGEGFEGVGPSFTHLHFLHLLISYSDPKILRICK